MLTAAAAPSPRGDRDRDRWSKRTVRGNHVREQRVTRLEAERLFHGLRETEVVGAGEELTSPIEPAGGEEFLGADDPELGAELGTDSVLAALTAREREIGDLDTDPARQDRPELCVLVVGVRADYQDALVRAQLGQRT